MVLRVHSSISEGEDSYMVHNCVTDPMDGTLCIYNSYDVLFAHMVNTIMDLIFITAVRRRGESTIHISRGVHWAIFLMIIHECVQGYMLHR